MLSYSTSSFKGLEEVKTDRFIKGNDSDLISTIRTRRSNFDETSKDKSAFIFNIVIKNYEKKQLNNVAQTIDLNSYILNNNENYNIDLLKKISQKTNKEN